MSEIKYTVCDRCGRKIEYKGWTANLFGVVKKSNKFRVYQIYNGNPTGYHYVNKSIELCKKCTEQLKLFLDGKATEEMEK